MITRPNSDEFQLNVEKYINLVPAGSLLTILQEQHDETLLILRDLTEKQAIFKYSEGKWSLKTVVGHIADVERLWSYRLLRIGRGDARELPGYDREIFVESSSADNVPLKFLLDDYSAIRQSTITLIKNLDEDALERRGVFNNHSLSAKASAFIIAGHERHHMSVIKAKYLVDSI